MTNREKFAEQILNVACGGDRIAVDKETGKIVPCASLRCKKCLFDGTRPDCMHAARQWCYSESTDWSKVPVDTPILVRDHESAAWRRGYFAKYENNRFYTWLGGGTSWSATTMVNWEYAKLAEESETE